MVSEAGPYDVSTSAAKFGCSAEPESPPTSCDTIDLGQSVRVPTTGTARIVPKQPFEGACARLAASGRSPHWSFVCRWSLGDESSNSFSALRLQGTAVVAVVRCSRNPELLQVACADVTPPRGFGAALWVHEHVHRSEARNRKCAILLKGSWERVRVCDVNPTQSGANVSYAPQPHCVALVELRAVRAVC